MLYRNDFAVFATPVIIVLAGCMRLCLTTANGDQSRVRRHSEVPLPTSPEPDEFGAVNALFRRLDDDANGNIDRAESDEFLKEELRYGTDGVTDKRHKNFHANGTDAFITVDELRDMWNRSAVRNWSSDDVVEWLSRSVGLDIYEEQFRKTNMVGRFMPCLAVNSDDIIGRTIGIQNIIHKNKIMLKATDVVLFGPPEADRMRKYKDVALTTALVGIVGFALLYRLQQRRHNLQMTRMNTELESLLKTELQWRDMQSNGGPHEHDSLDSASKQNSFDEAERDRLHHAEEEVIALRQALRAAEARHKEHAELKSDVKWSAPYELIVLLQLTYALETENYKSRKAHAEAQLQEARICCERLRKRRGLASLIAPIRYATTSLPEELDTRIADAKVALQEVMEMCHERKNRWSRIEMLVQAAVIHNGYGIEQLKSMVARRRGSSSTSSAHNGWRRGSRHSMLSDATTATVSGSHQPSSVHNSTSSVTLDHYPPPRSAMKPNHTTSNLFNNTPNNGTISSPLDGNEREPSSSSSSLHSGSAVGLVVLLRPTLRSLTPTQPNSRHHTLSGIMESPTTTPHVGDHSVRPVFDNHASMDSVSGGSVGDSNNAYAAYNGFVDDAVRLRSAAPINPVIDSRITASANHLLNIPTPPITKRSNTFVAATNFMKSQQHTSADAVRNRNGSPVECCTVTNTICDAGTASGRHAEDETYDNVEFRVRDNSLQRHKNSIGSASSGHLSSTAAAAASNAEHNRKVLESGITPSKPAATTNGLKSKRSFVNLFRHHKSDKDIMLTAADNNNKKHVTQT